MLGSTPRHGPSDGEAPPVIMRMSPEDPITTDPNRFPWVPFLLLVLAYLLLMFGGTHVVERTWGMGPAEAYQGLTSCVWLIGVALWLTLRGGGNRG